MSDLIVIGYDSWADAEDARQSLMQMKKEYLVELSDAVVAEVDQQGTIRLNQMVNLWSAGAVGGSFWGLLVGLLFIHPLLGVVAGASAGALTGALTDFGIDDRFIKDVSRLLKPGQAALFVMTENAPTDRVIEQLARHGGEVIRTNLDLEQEDRVRAAFAEAHRAALAHHAATQAA